MARSSPANIKIKIDDADPSTDIHVTENGDAGRVIGEVLFDNFDSSLSYTFAFVDPDDTSQTVTTPFEVVEGTGSDAGRFFFKLLDGTALDLEGRPLPAFSLAVTDSDGNAGDMRRRSRPCSRSRTAT